MCIISIVRFTYQRSIMFEINDCVGLVTCNVGKKIAETFNEKLLVYGMTRTQWIAIYYIGKYGMLNQRELSEKMHIKDSTMVRLIDRLERDNLVQRVKDSKDRRITHLRLTEKGIGKRDEILPIGEEFSISISSGLTIEEVNIYKKVLYRLLENVSA